MMRLPLSSMDCQFVKAPMRLPLSSMDCQFVTATVRESRSVENFDKCLLFSTPGYESYVIGSCLV
jgi:hypothetical protein